jgi:hypothetical protein
VENCWKWSADELIAWAGAGRLTEWLAPRVHAAVPRAGAMSSEAWSGLEIILNAAGPFKDRLIRLFAATALLSPQSDMLRTSLQAHLTGVPLTAWHHGTWRLVSVPCVGHTPTMITLMCGHSTEKPPDVEPANLSPETQDAIALTASLASRKWGGHFVCWHWSGKNDISGASLGLPVFLGFGCAAEGVPMPRALATGKLDATGAIEPVENVENKATLAGDRGFFIPEANASGTLTACISVGHIDDAWDLWKSCASGENPEYLRTLLMYLDKPERLFPSLLNCTEAELTFLDTPGRLRRIHEVLRKRRSLLAGLRPLLVEIATSQKRRHHKARDFILKIFPQADLPRVAESDPAVAWRLAMLHIRAFNHSGHPKEAAELREVARQWEDELAFSDNEEEIISHSLSVVGLLHNTYGFRADPREVLGPSLLAQLATLEKAHAASGKKKNKPLGDWYGTLAQHHAFRGELSEAENYFEKAISCFDGRPEDRKQSLSYRFFARLDAGKPEALDDLLNVLEIEQLDQNIAVHIQQIDNDYTRSWALFALARYAVDSEAAPALHTPLAEVAETLAQQDRVWGMTSQKHPWQLILFNLGFIAETDAARQRLWGKSLELCLHDKSGPTINVMALLPLSAMKAHGLVLPEDTEVRVARIFHIIRDGLDTTHFAPVLSATGWPEALDEVMANRRKFFPFNYR